MKRYTFAIIAAAAVVSCGPKSSSPAPSAPVSEVTPLVSVTTAAYETVSRDGVYPATVQANVLNNIAPQGSGRIQKLNVEVGDFVQAGQVLAEMDRVQLDQAELRLRNEETELARVKELFAQGGISQSDYESLELSCKVSRSSYENVLENTILRSPVSGVISARNYDRGDMYSMGTPIFTVQQISPVKLLVAISETDYTKVKRGDKVSITADALPGESFSGSVNRVYPTIDPASHTFNTEVLVPNSNRKLRPGMYAKVSVNFGSSRSIVVPDSAVIKQQGSGQRIIYTVAEDNTVKVNMVTLGQHFDGKYEITSGLAEGETVVVKGQSALRSGIKVEIQK